MIPLIKCPGCQGKFKRIKQNERWHQELCENRCPLDYSQYHKIDFDDNDIGYFTFQIKDFHVYVYIDHYSLKDIIYIYNKIFPRGESSQLPIFRIPIIEIDWNKLDHYNNTNQSYRIVL